MSVSGVLAVAFAVAVVMGLLLWATLESEGTWW